MNINDTHWFANIGDSFLGDIVRHICADHKSAFYHKSTDNYAQNPADKNEPVMLEH